MEGGREGRTGRRWQERYREGGWLWWWGGKTEKRAQTVGRLHMQADTHRALSLGEGTIYEGH